MNGSRLWRDHQCPGRLGSVASVIVISMAARRRQFQTGISRSSPRRRSSTRSRDQGVWAIGSSTPRQPKTSTHHAILVRRSASRRRRGRPDDLDRSTSRTRGVQCRPRSLLTRSPPPWGFQRRHRFVAACSSLGTERVRLSEREDQTPHSVEGPPSAPRESQTSRPRILTT